MNISALALIGGLIYALTTFGRRVLPVNLKAWQVQASSFVIGLGVVFLVSAGEITGRAVRINGVLLNDFDLWSKVIIGLLATGLFAVIPADLMKALDNNRNGTITSETTKEGT